MSQQTDKRNYDVVSISRADSDKRKNHVQHALYIERAKIAKVGQFVKVFADMFLTKETKGKAYR